MKISRRNFVRTSAAAIVAIGFVGTGQTAGAQIMDKPDLFPIPPESTLDPLNYLTSKHFSPFVDSVMTVKGSDGRYSNVRLVEVVDAVNSKNVKNGYEGEAYSLFFEPVKKAPLTPDTYSFDHPYLGEFSLTILPVGMSRRFHQAVVNRIARSY